MKGVLNNKFDRMRRVVFICFLMLTFGVDPSFAQSIQNAPINPSPKFKSDIIVLKLKSPGSSAGRIAYSANDQLSEIKKLIDFEEQHQVFSQQSFSNARTSDSDLQNIYKIKLKPGANIFHEISKLKKLGFIQYAEPYFQNELLLIPNDPQANPTGGLQDYLTLIKAYDAWNITRSDSSVVIGIVDTGVSSQHEDLGNVAFNYDDPINGIDDDGDGYIDNFRGWDLSDNDNNPEADGNGHGSQVAGLSSATTNNGIGMAGIGFNSKYLPVKIAETSTKILTNEYEGIIYAADHGAKVINLSWGSAGSYSEYGRDIINYAVLEKDVVVVAAAGNTPDELDFYPASFDHVLSVAATDINDHLASWATYSTYVDLSAPGDGVYTTKNGDAYEKAVGSSFSAPIVSGAAALVRAHFPEMTAIQVTEQLRITSDDIYSVGSNMDFYGKMGRGRLNVHRALSDIMTPSVRLTDSEYKGNHGELIFPGDTLELLLTFTNYLRTAENVSVTISNPSGNAQFKNDKIYIESLGEFGTFRNAETPIVLIVDENTAPGEKLVFRIDFSGNGYTDFQYFEIETTPEFFDISDGKFTATISSDGDIGFDEAEFNNGNGVSFLENLISGQTGLIVSSDSVHVLDNVINNFSSLTRDEDFVAETSVKLYDNSEADTDARSVFKSKSGMPAALDIKIEQKILAWDSDDENGSLIFEYRLINTGDTLLSGINAALFADWDLGDFESNEAAWDSVNHFGYVFEKEAESQYAGIALITDQAKTYFAVDKSNKNANTPDLDSIFDDALKHQFLSTNTPKTQAGTLGAGNDVAHLVGAKDISISPNQAVKVTFVMAASTSLEGLRSEIASAKANYQTYLNTPPLAEIFYACPGEAAIVDPKGEVYEFFSDPQATVRIDSGTTYTTDPVYEDQIYYAINLDSAYAGDVMRFMVKSGQPTASFTWPSDTLLVESGKLGNIQITNTSLLSDTWSWDFGNGYSGVVEDPLTSYSEAGVYTVKLQVSNIYGCSDSTSRELLVGIRSDRPLTENQEICKGTKTSVSASNTSAIKVYGNVALNQLLYEGNEFETDEITSDTVFYVVNIEGLYESISSKVYIKSKHPEMGFSILPDTLNLTEKYVLEIRNTSGESAGMNWLINGVPASEDQSFTYKYDENPIEIEQLKIDGEGCTDTLSKNISPAISSLPIVKDLEVCPKSKVMIKLQNGKVFYFYNDSDLSELVHKGRSMEIIGIDETKTFYITGVDKFLESPAVPVQVNIDPVKAVIQTSADTIDFAKEQHAEITNVSENAVHSFWLESTGTFDTTSVFTEIYDYPGIYDYTVVAQSQSGCTDTAFHSVRVISVTGLEEEDLYKFNIYPNPVSDVLTIEIGQAQDADTDFELLDISGKRHAFFTIQKGGSRFELNISKLTMGVYILRSLDAERPFIYKVLKE